MNQITRLVEQHIAASESHLRYIDELMERANAPGTASVTPDMAAKLAQMRQDRDRMAQELDAVRAQTQHGQGDTAEAARRSEGVQGVLQTMGREFEKALLAVLDSESSDRPAHGHHA